MVRVLGVGLYIVFVCVVLFIVWFVIVGGFVLVLMEIVVDYGVVEYFSIFMFMIGIFRIWFEMGEWLVVL